MAVSPVSFLAARLTARCISVRPYGQLRHTSAAEAAMAARSDSPAPTCAEQIDAAGRAT
jgi:hypothetical protein